MRGTVAKRLRKEARIGVTTKQQFKAKYKRLKKLYKASNQV